MDLAAQRLLAQVAAEEDCADGLAELGQRLIGRVLQVVAVESFQVLSCFRTQT